MSWIKATIIRLRAELRSLITMRLGTMIVAATFTMLVSGWGALEGFGKSYASHVAITLVKSVIDSVSTVAHRADSTAKAAQDSVLVIKAIIEEGRRLQEISIYAERSSNPRFDKALKNMARASETAIQSVKENHDLIQKIKRLNPVNP